MKKVALVKNGNNCDKSCWRIFRDLGNFLKYYFTIINTEFKYF